MLRKAVVIFGSAFILNLLWEEAHAILYVHYKGTEITHFILLRAAFVDAVIITLFSMPFLRFSHYTRKQWLLFVALLVFAVGIEKWALSSDRWAYTDAMPLIPYLWVGLTPTLQLALTGFVAFRVSNSISPIIKKNGSSCELPCG